MCRHSVAAVSYGGFAKLHLLIVVSSSHHESANLRLENLVRTISQCHRRQTNLAPPGCAVPGQHPVFILSHRTSSHSLLASPLSSPCTVSLCLRCRSTCGFCRSIVPRYASSSERSTIATNRAGGSARCRWPWRRRRHTRREGGSALHKLQLSRRLRRRPRPAGIPTAPHRSKEE